jgi:hypothetical protein
MMQQQQENDNNRMDLGSNFWPSRQGSNLLWELTLRAQVESVESVFYARCFFVSISVPRMKVLK